MIQKHSFFAARVILLFVICTCRFGISGPDYFKQLQDKLLYLEALSTYAYHPQWDMRWRDGQFSQNQVRFNFGSVETDELMCLYNLQLNLPLNRNLYLEIDHQISETQHHQSKNNELFLGMRRQFYKQYSAFFQLKLAYDKEEIDGRIGMMFLSADGKSYLRIAARFDDFIWDEKNDRAGVSVQKPLAGEWQLRTTAGPFTVNSTGQWGRPFKRRFPDPVQSAGLLASTCLENRARANAYLKLSPLSYFVADIEIYQFKETKSFFDHSADCGFRNDLTIGGLQWFGPLNKHYHFRVMTIIVNQRSRGSGLQKRKLERNELLGALFIDRSFKRFSLELGLMGSRYQREPTADGYTQKILLACAHPISRKGIIRFSLSHVFSLGGFGGANLQLIKSF